MIIFRDGLCSLHLTMMVGGKRQCWSLLKQVSCRKGQAIKTPQYAKIRTQRILHAVPPSYCHVGRMTLSAPFHQAKQRTPSRPSSSATKSEKSWNTWMLGGRMPGGQHLPHAWPREPSQLTNPWRGYGYGYGLCRVLADWSSMAHQGQKFLANVTRRHKECERKSLLW